MFLRLLNDLTYFPRLGITRQWLLGMRSRRPPPYFNYLLRPTLSLLATLIFFVYNILCLIDSSSFLIARRSMVGRIGVALLILGKLEQMHGQKDTHRACIQ
jgi:hypothetical protein